MLVLDKILTFMAEQEKKGPLQKLKENITDKEEQLTFISVVTTTCCCCFYWILTPHSLHNDFYSNEPKDITFPASLLTGALASFGLDNKNSKVGIKTRR